MLTTCSIALTTERMPSGLSHHHLVILSFFFFPPFAEAVTTPTCKNTPKPELIQSWGTPTARWLLNALRRRSAEPSSPCSLHHLLQQLVETQPGLSRAWTTGRLPMMAREERSENKAPQPVSVIPGSGGKLDYLSLLFSLFKCSFLE